MSRLALRSLLGLPAAYSLFTSIVGGRKGRRDLVETHIRPSPGDRILDIGCGPGSLIEYLPQVVYVGFDSNPNYIEAAKKHYPGRGDFRCLQVSRDAIGENRFDIVIASGVVHHLDDRHALELFELARTVLRAGGRLVTLDGCYVEGQSYLARWLLSKDRGEFVRNREGYLSLASHVFEQVSVVIRDDLLRPIPYTHIILECSR